MTKKSKKKYRKKSSFFEQNSLIFELFCSLSKLNSSISELFTGIKNRKKVKKPVAEDEKCRRVNKMHDAKYY